MTGGGKGALQAAENVRIRTIDPKAGLTYPDHWNTSDVRGALLAIHGRCCAYCQSGLPHNDPGDVEHFRPKSVYWWLAYDFANFFLACSRCNRIYKREKFPLPKGSTPWTWADRDRLEKERTLLIDPAVDDVEAWFRWERQCEILFFIRPAINLEPQSEPYIRVDTTIKFFRLNRNVLLVKHRSRAICGALRAYKLARRGDESKAQEIRTMASRWQPHGASIRQIMSGLAPHLIPSPDEDLVHLILNLLDELVLAETLQNASQQYDDSSQRFPAEILWALAVLWKDPPAGSPDLVERCLKKMGRRDEIAVLRSQI